MPGSTSSERSTGSRSAPGSWRCAGSTSRSFRFAADFARSLDYYTGFIFEAADPRRADGKPVVGGGRYDRLLQHLGATEPVPAVGCSIWIERIVERP